ncbi:MAG: NeuD/PglB/VioB family sugar acetyltransferase [Acutalibacteraceae bacterium]|nr:NeuD/PglB/VioB family sugar acetyltransferase [Acutalibacteraceae bacterium]
MILAIYGGGGLGREALEIARQMNAVGNKWEEIVVVDDVQKCERVNDAKRVCFDDFLKSYDKNNARFVIAIGEPEFRKKLFCKVENAGFSFETLIHPSVHIPGTAKIGKGVIVFPNVFVSCNTQIGDNVCIQGMCTLCHDSEIKPSSVLAPGCVICGHCTIGSGTFIGARTAVKEDTTIGNDCIIGIGSTVIHNINDNSVAVGTPAKFVKNKNGMRVFK